MANCVVTSSDITFGVRANVFLDGRQEFRCAWKSVVRELAECQRGWEADTSARFPTEFFARLNARKKVWAPFYTIHKIMAGLLDMHSAWRQRRKL